MASNYDEIHKENIREYGQGTAHLLFLSEELYADPTHFIFELIQNAEDASAKNILFKLYEDRLEIYHDGKLFTEDDVKGICGFAKSTKKEDLTKIGKFGIGFKSVYAFTDTPYVHCADENFYIKLLVRPTEAEKNEKLQNPWTTLFVMPFNKEKVNPEEAYSQIKKKLSELNVQTILFLRKIEKINYYFETEEETGQYSKKSVQKDGYRLVTVFDGIESEGEKWMLFERLILSSIEEEELPENIFVEIAFRLRNNDEINNFMKVGYSPIVVFFPTDKETKCGFLIQGPFKTTPARDNIPYTNEWNKKLINEIGFLLEESIKKIKNLGLINVSFLETLAVREENFPIDGMFRPIYETIKKVFWEMELLPTNTDEFVSAENALLASSEWLKTHFNDKQLKYLFGKHKRWVNSLISESKQELWYFLRNVITVPYNTPDSIIRETNDDFFKKQTDKWLVNFYLGLRNQRSLWKKGWKSWRNGGGPLLDKAFIRLQNGEHVRPYDFWEKANCYIPPEQKVTTTASLIKKRIIDADLGIKSFFRNDLELPEFDILAEIKENILPKYKTENDLLPGKEENLKDLENIARFYRTATDTKCIKIKNLICDIPMIFSCSFGGNNESYQAAENLYFSEKPLKTYFSNNNEIYFVSPIYHDNEAIMELLDEIGVSKEVKIELQSPDRNNYVEYMKKKCVDYRRGLSRFYPLIKVDGLEFALSCSSFDKSLFIWNEIVVPNAPHIYGKIEFSRNKNYSVSRTEECFSEFFGKILMEAKWLPDQNGAFFKPNQIRIEDLPDEFIPNQNVARALRMKTNDTEEAIKKVSGGDPNLGKFIEEITGSGDMTEEKMNFLWEAWRQSKKPIFPSDSSQNPDRRKTKAREMINSAAPRNYEKKERNLRTDERKLEKGVYLREKYTNIDDELICQICKLEMPFKKTDGNYYFESVEVLTKDYLIEKELETTCLALCPLCAAKFKELVKRDDDQKNKIWQGLLNCQDLEIPISFREEQSSIRFVKTHLIDLKEALKRNK